MANITKELAIQIAKKLKAKMEKNRRAHDIAVVEHEGKLIAQFGIRRGSRKSMGHDHIPSQIHVSARDARLLGECPLSRSDWIKIVTEKGRL